MAMAMAVTHRVIPDSYSYFHPDSGSDSGSDSDSDSPLKALPFADFRGRLGPPSRIGHSPGPFAMAVTH
jgi:hypothetical protein